MNRKVVVITRSFQIGTGGRGRKFDAKVFACKVAIPIIKLLRFEEIVEKIIVVTNGESGNRLAENMEDGRTPTITALEETFPREISSGKIHGHICRNWGPNSGSAIALNEGAEIARQSNVEWIMNWSPEIDMDGYLMSQALNFAERRELLVVGFARERWWEKPQWNVVQNTAAMWQLSLLGEIGGFAPECNGAGEIITLSEFGEVPIAGMEDFHAMLRAMKARKNIRWGMVGRENPLRWDTSFPSGSERERLHLIKVARQYAVMKIWTAQIFPELSFESMMGRLFSFYHLD